MPLLAATAAGAGDVGFRLGLAGSGKSTVVAIIDLRNAPANAVVSYAEFDATVIASDGTRKRLAFDMLAAGGVFNPGTEGTRAFRHGVTNARRIESPGLRWGLAAGGGKADEIGQLAPAVISTIALPPSTGSSGVPVAPPPAADTTASCRAYGTRAVTQQASNLAARCRFRSARWSDDAAYHANWCRTAPRGAAVRETRTRDKLIADCRKTNQISKNG